MNHSTKFLTIFCLALMASCIAIPVATTDVRADAVPAPNLAISELTTADMTPFMDVEGWLAWVQDGAMIDKVEEYVKAYQATPKLWAMAAGVAIDNLAKMLGLAGQTSYASNNVEVFSEAISDQLQNAMANVYYNMEQEMQYGDMMNDMIASRVHWAAKAQFEAQKAAGEPYVFDLDKAIIDSGVYKDGLIHVQNAANHYKANLGILDKIGENFIGDYETLKLTALFNNIHHNQATSGLNQTHFIPTYWISAGGYFYANQTEFWVLPHRSGLESTITIKDSANNIVAEITQYFDQHRLQKLSFDLPAGRYKYEVSEYGPSLLGMVMPAMTNSATLTATMIVLDQSNGNLISFYKSGYGDASCTHGSSWAPMWFRASSVGTNPNWQSVNFFIGATALNFLGVNKTNDDGLLTKMNQLVGQSKTIMTTAVGAAQSAYNTAAALGQWPTALVSPVDVLPYGDRMANFTAAQWAVAYYAWLKSVTEWSGEGMENITVLASPEALDLTIRGDIYAPNGSLIHSDMIFTPYVSVETDLVKGQNNTFNGATFFIRFGVPGQTIANATMDNIRLIDISNGSTVYIHEMTSFGEQIEEIHLTVLTLEELNMPDPNPITPPPQNMDEWDLLVKYWYYAVLVLGIVLLLGGIIIKAPYVIVAGILLAVIGGLVAMTDGSSILSYMTDPFMPDWWPW